MNVLKTLVILALGGLFTGCVLVGRPHPVLRGGTMSYRQAVAIGSDDCHRRGYHCDLKEAHQTGNGIWKVKFRVIRGNDKGHLHLDYDTHTGALVKVDEKVKAKGGRHHDDDHDDDDHGRGRRHGASAGRHD